MKFRGWTLKIESLGSIGPGVLWVIHATKGGEQLQASFTSNRGEPRAELVSMIRHAIKMHEANAARD